MRHRYLVALAAMLIVTPTLGAQSTPTPATGKKSTSRATAIMGQIADTALTSAASMATDTLLGDKAGMVAAIMGASGPTCPAGLIAIPSQYAGIPGAPGSGAGAAGMPGVPSAGSAIVGMAKKKLAGKKADAAAAAAGAAGAGVPANVTASAGAAAPEYMCGTPDQVTAAMQSAQGAGGMGGAGGMKSTMGAALAATPQGALVGGAVAAAPVAGAAAKKLGGVFGKGGQSAESMKKDLAKGKLTVKKLKFVEDSDELAAGFESDLAMLAEALQATEGSFVLRVPIEGDGSEPNVALAERRTQRVFAHLLVSGIPNGRVVTASGGKPVKKGDARVELVSSDGEGGQ